MNYESIRLEDIPNLASPDADAPAETPATDVNRIAQLTKLLRWLGGTTLICAGLAFILQGWNGWHAMERYYSFLGFSVVLSICGLYCGLRVKDDKSARTFLGVATALVPAHFVQLGALVYSLTLSGPAQVPQFFLMQAPSIAAVLIASALTLIVLLPTTFGGFSIFARPMARTLTLTYFASNALLLLPTRDANSVMLIVAIAAIALTVIDRKLFRHCKEMATYEGYASRLMLATPLLIMVGRNIVLYRMTTLLFASVWALLAVVLFSVIPAVLPTAAARFSRGVSVFPTAIAWMLALDGLFFSYRSALFPSLYYYRADLLLPSWTLCLAITLVILSFSATGMHQGFRRTAAWVAMGGMIFQLLAQGGVAASIFCVVTSIAVIFAAFTAEDRSIFRVGIAGFILGLLYHLRYAVDLYTLSPWICLAVTGIVVVLLSAVIEKHHARLLQQFAQLRLMLDEWEQKETVPAPQMQ